MEIGATWITGKFRGSIFIKKVAIRIGWISIKLDSDEDKLKPRLDEMKDTLTEKFGLIKVADSGKRLEGNLLIQ